MDIHTEPRLVQRDYALNKLAKPNKNSIFICKDVDSGPNGFARCSHLLGSEIGINRKDFSFYIIKHQTIVP